MKKPYQVLRDAHDLLTAYQQEQGEPLASIARIVTAIEEELQRKPILCPVCGQERQSKKINYNFKICPYCHQKQIIAPKTINCPHCPLWAFENALTHQQRREMA
jgi:predicted Zn-ribbon and HTH transcriptional regulator